MPEPLELLGDGLGERLGCGGPGRRELRRERRPPAPAAAETARSASASGSAPASTSASSARAAAARASSSSVVAASNRRRASAMRSSSASTASSRPGSASSEARNARSVEAPSRTRISASSSSAATSPSSGARAATAWSARAASRHARGRARRAVLLGVERLGGGRGGLGQLGHVPEPLALGQQPVLVPGLDPVGARHELGELREALRRARRPRRRARRDGGGRRPARARRAGARPGGGAAPRPTKASRTSSWWDGPGEAALLELAGHGEQPLDERREILARDRAAPRVRARAPVREDAPRGHEPLLAGRPQLGDGFQRRVVEDPLGEVELGLDVGLLRPRAEVGGVAGRPEQEPDGLREDRLPRAGLAGDRVQPGREGRDRPRG